VKIGDRIDGDELLLRQVNPAFVRDGRPSSQVFRPTPKDEGMVSVNRGSRCTAEAAYQQFITRPECRSCGVLAVSVAECAAEQLAALDAPLIADDDGCDDPAHAIIDFRGISKNAAEKKAGRLGRIAEVRGFLFGPVATTAEVAAPDVGTAAVPISIVPASAPTDPNDGDPGN
jgi:hypothetical protein